VPNISLWPSSSSEPAGETISSDKDISATVRISQGSYQINVNLRHSFNGQWKCCKAFLLNNEF